MLESISLYFKIASFWDIVLRVGMFAMWLFCVYVSYRYIRIMIQTHRKSTKPSTLWSRTERERDFFRKHGYFPKRMI